LLAVIKCSTSGEAKLQTPSQSENSKTDVCQTAQEEEVFRRN